MVLNIFHVGGQFESHNDAINWANDICWEDIESSVRNVAGYYKIADVDDNFVTVYYNDVDDSYIFVEQWEER